LFFFFFSFGIFWRAAGLEKAERKESATERRKKKNECLGATVVERGRNKKGQ